MGSTFNKMEPVTRATGSLTDPMDKEFKLYLVGLVISAPSYRARDMGSVSCSVQMALNTMASLHQAYSMDKVHTTGLTKVLTVGRGTTTNGLETASLNIKACDI